MKNIVRVIISCLLFPLSLRGQGNAVRIGLSIPYAIKFGIINRSGSHYSPIGSTGLNLSCRIDGQGDRTLSWQQHIGLAYDKLSYKVEDGNFLQAEQYNLAVESEVLFPTAKSTVQLSVGIGIYYAFDVVAVSHSNSNSTGNFYSNIDSFGNVLSDNSRNTLPFISIGMFYQLNSKCQLGVRVRQMLRDAFNAQTTITYYIDRQPKSIVLSYQPTLLEVGFTYFFFRRLNEN